MDKNISPTWCIALLGSLERFFGILIEHYAGAFPTWLAPEQVRILPISEKFEEYASKIAAQLREKQIRTGIDLEADPIGGKIRRARGQRIPYLLVVGEKELENGSVAVRSRANGEEGAVPFQEFLERIQKEITEMA